jgi:hypothetical protein
MCSVGRNAAHEEVAVENSLFFVNSPVVYFQTPIDHHSAIRDTKEAAMRTLLTAILCVFAFQTTVS